MKLTLIPVPETTIDVGPVAKRLQEEGADLGKTSFRALANGRVLHGVKPARINCQNLTFGKTAVKHTWETFLKNTPYICKDCLPSLTHSGGWSSPPTTLNALYTIIELGDASREVLEADARGELTPGVALKLVRAARHRSRRALVPKAFREFTKRQLQYFYQVTHGSLSKEGSLLLLATLSLNSNLNSSLEASVVELMELEGFSVVSLGAGVNSLRESLKWSETMYNEYWNSSFILSEDLLIFSAVEAFFEKESSIGVLPTYAANILASRTRGVFNEVSSESAVLISSKTIETLNVLAKDSPPQNAKMFSSLVETAIELEK